MKKISFLALVLPAMILTGCFYLEPVKIHQPSSMISDSRALQSLDPGSWQPDGTRAIFQNYSKRLRLKLWIGKKPLGQPDFELGPEEGRAFNFPDFGAQTIYVAGWEPTISGWQSIGIKKRSVNIYPSGWSREVSVGDWDFSEYYSQLSNSWH